MASHISHTEEYQYKVEYSRDDNAFIATVAEFPSLSCVENSAKEALNGLKELIADILVEMEEDGEIQPCTTYRAK